MVGRHSEATAGIREAKNKRQLVPVVGDQSRRVSLTFLFDLVSSVPFLEKI